MLASFLRKKIMILFFFHYFFVNGFLYSVFLFDFCKFNYFASRPTQSLSRNVFGPVCLWFCVSVSLCHRLRSLRIILIAVTPSTQKIKQNHKSLPSSVVYSTQKKILWFFGICFGYCFYYPHTLRDWVVPHTCRFVLFICDTIWKPGKMESSSVCSIFFL